MTLLVRGTVGFIPHWRKGNVGEVCDGGYHALAELHADQANLAAHQAKQARLTSLAQAVEADAAAIVEQHLWEAYGEKVRAFYQQFQQTVEALQEHARREFGPVARKLRYHLIGSISLPRKTFLPYLRRLHLRANFPYPPEPALFRDH